MKNNKKYIFYILVLCISIYVFYSFFSRIKFFFEETALWLFPSNEDRNGEFLKIVLSIIGGAGVLYSLHLAYKRLLLTNKGLELQSEAINKQSEQLDLSRKGQVDERFKNAVEHLGSDKEPIILGGVVELHQIAKEEKEKYSAVVFNILTSYLRSVLKVSIPREDDFSTTIPQTIIDFLFKNEGIDLYKNLKPNLSFCNLNDLDINGSNFTSGNFSFSIMPMHINDVFFEDVKFGRTQFTIGRLNNVNFRSADFHDNLFNFCELNNVDFYGAKFYSQFFINTKFSDCKFSDMNFYNSKFLLCHFENSNFIKSELLNTHFLGSNFVSSNFSNNEITNVDYIGSGFLDTSFESRFFKCNFSGIQLKYNFDYIQVKDIEKNIDKPINKTGIRELPLNSFLNCYWGTLTYKDYKDIENECETIVSKWEEKYKKDESENEK